MNAVPPAGNGGSVSEDVLQGTPDLRDVTCQCGQCKCCIDVLLFVVASTTLPSSEGAPLSVLPDGWDDDDFDDDFDYLRCDCPFCAGWDYYQWTQRRPPEWMRRQQHMVALGAVDAALNAEDNSEERSQAKVRKYSERERRQERRKRRN